MRRRWRLRHEAVPLWAFLFRGLVEQQLSTEAPALSLSKPPSLLRASGSRVGSMTTTTKRFLFQGQQQEAENNYWYRDGVNFKCTACGKCCKTRGDVWLNPDELQQAANLTRLDRQGFIDIYVEEVTKEGWVRLRSRRGSDGVTDGACIFLDNANQCSIYEARPLQCRTYPYWPRVIKSRESWDNEAVVEDDKEGKHWNEEDGGCEGINHPEGELVDFVHIRKELIKQAYYYRDFPA